jgi:hypothetical protein
MCKKIHRGGNAEQYHADKKYKEAVAVAVEACADDTKGQTCYICTQALHWKTKEGLVRMCSCRGTAGFAHLSCLAEQAKILVAEAQENNLGESVFIERFHRWDNCSLCKQEYHGVVRCALGWACWKTYVGRPETDWGRRLAIQVLGTGLSIASYHQDALSVKLAGLSMLRRNGEPELNILIVQNNLANTYEQLGNMDGALDTRHEIYSQFLRLRGEENLTTLQAADNYADTLVVLKRFEEAKSLMLKVVPIARRVLGDRHTSTLRLRWIYARALYKHGKAEPHDLREVLKTVEETAPTARRVLGGAHPYVVSMEGSLLTMRASLHARESGAS